MSSLSLVLSECGRCAHCGFSCGDDQRMAAHCLAHHLSAEVTAGRKAALALCAVCGDPFPRREQLEAHFRAAHFRWLRRTAALDLAMAHDGPRTAPAGAQAQQPVKDQAAHAQKAAGTVPNPVRRSLQPAGKTAGERKAEKRSANKEETRADSHTNPRPKKVRGGAVATKKEEEEEVDVKRRQKYYSYEGSFVSATDTKWKEQDRQREEQNPAGLLGELLKSQEKLVTNKKRVQRPGECRKDDEKGKEKKRKKGEETATPAKDLEEEVKSSSGTSRALADLSLSDTSDDNDGDDSNVDVTAEERKKSQEEMLSEEEEEEEEEAIDTAKLLEEMRRADEEFQTAVNAPMLP